MKETMAEPEAAKVLVSTLMSCSGIPDRRSCRRSARGFNFFSDNGLRGPISEYEIIPSARSAIFTVVIVMPVPPDKCTRIAGFGEQSLSHFEKVIQNGKRGKG